MGAIDSLKPIILFDGVCNLCNSSVLFVIKHVRTARFSFASLQSTFGQLQRKKFNLPLNDLNTLLLVKDGHLLTRSTAALEIAKQLDGLWPGFYIFKIVPAFLRDGVYDFVAKNRYKWFGKKESCMIPTPALRARFIET